MVPDLVATVHPDRGTDDSQLVLLCVADGKTRAIVRIKSVEGGGSHCREISRQILPCHYRNLRPQGLLWG